MPASRSSRARSAARRRAISASTSTRALTCIGIIVGTLPIRRLLSCPLTDREGSGRGASPTYHLLCELLELGAKCVGLVRYRLCDARHQRARLGDASPGGRAGFLSASSGFVGFERRHRLVVFPHHLDELVVEVVGE